MAELRIPSDGAFQRSLFKLFPALSVASPAINFKSSCGSAGLLRHLDNPELEPGHRRRRVVKGHATIAIILQGLVCVAEIDVLDAA